MVEENETIDQCLERIKKAGYEPISRIEKPVFAETKAGEKQVVSRKIIFEAKKIN
ncbi:NETI motif-containing protein [Bacillaceae bacterium Marseille-Q3522]|nr:NETI motif-containing protein [Bacillaceae bacterium Marseille-Q3522]